MKKAGDTSSLDNLHTHQESQVAINVNFDHLGKQLEIIQKEEQVFFFQQQW